MAEKPKAESPFMISGGPSKQIWLQAGIDKIYRDTILGHSLKGMDVNYIVVDDEALTRAIGKYTKWIDSKIDPTFLDFSLTKKEVS